MSLPQVPETGDVDVPGSRAMRVTVVPNVGSVKGLRYAGSAAAGTE